MAKTLKNKANQVRKSRRCNKQPRVIQISWGRTALTAAPVIAT